MKILNSIKKSIFIPATLMLLLSGCAHTYTFNNQTFSSPTDALTAHKQYLETIENELTPYKATPKGKAVIITPSKKTCEALGIKRTGQPAQELIDYLGKFQEEDYHFFYRFLLKSNLFISVDSLVEDFPVQATNRVKNNYDIIIYLDMRSPTQISWMLIYPPNNKPQQINTDKLAKTGTPKIKSWLDDIKRNIEEDK